MPRHKNSPSVRFWSKVEVRTPSECWPWLGGRDKCGYARFCAKGYSRIAARALLQMMHGPLADDIETRHLCGKGHEGCVNPYHVVPGSHQDNMDDKTRAGTNSGAKGGQHPKAKVTEAVVLEMRGRAAEGASALGREFGMTPSAVSAILLRRNWRHV